MVINTVLILMVCVVAVMLIIGFRLKSSFGKKMFVKAVKRGNISSVKSLLNQGISPDARDKNGTPALVWASYKGHTDMVELLLEFGVQVNARSGDGGATALFAASDAGHSDIVKVLLDSGAEPDAKTRDDGRTSLWQASQNGHPAVVRLLLNVGADAKVKTTDKNQTALFMASEQGHNDIVKLLLDNGAGVNEKEAQIKRHPCS